MYAAFHMNDFMEGLLGERDLLLDFNIYDGVGYVQNEDNLMYSTKCIGDNPESIQSLEYLNLRKVREPLLS